MIQNDERTELGTIKIHNDVIASIAYLATLEIEGVSRICENIRSIGLGLIGKKLQHGAIDVKSDNIDGLVITIPVILRYGCNIPDVASKIQERVRSSIEEATDLTSREIVVKIKGVEK